MLRSIRPVARALASRGVRQASTATAPISTPTLISIEKRWNHMSTVEQDDIVSQLAERQKGAWGELTLAEKQAAWYISYGAWGPRKPIHPEGEISKILMGITAGVVATVVLFAGVRMFADEMPFTMSREWQEASDKILAGNNANPFSNYSQVQSPSTGYVHESEDEDDE